MDTENNQPDMIAQVGKMLGRLKAGMAGIEGNANEDDDRTIVLASAILAVAAELREISNNLVQAMAENAAYHAEWLRRDALWMAPDADEPNA